MAFVVFVCWQALGMIGTTPAPGNAGDNATDISGAPVDDEQMRQMQDTLNTLNNENGRAD